MIEEETNSKKSTDHMNVAMRSVRVRSYVQGYLDAKRDDGKLLDDVVFKDLHSGFRNDVVNKAVTQVATFNRVKRGFGEAHEPFDWPQ